MRVYEQCLSLHTTEGPRNLRIQTKLKAYLRLPRSSQAAHFHDLAEAEDNVKEVLLRIVSEH